MEFVEFFKDEEELHQVKKRDHCAGSRIDH